MKENTKSFIMLGAACASGIIGFLVMNTTMSTYSIFLYTLAIVLLPAGLSSLFSSNKPEDVYEKKVQSILNTYDSILVKSNNVPKIEDRNIINVMSIDDLVDAQLEIRKPICYLKQTESCSFVLLDEKEAYIYIEKLNDKVVSPVEIEIKESKLKAKAKEDMDSEMLKEIEKTTIVKLSNQKSYKVSPVRKKKKTYKEDLEIL